METGASSEFPTEGNASVEQWFEKSIQKNQIVGITDRDLVMKVNNMSKVAIGRKIM